MPRCPMCGSANITIVISLHPAAFCSTCGARWIQDGSEQRAITQVQEPALFAARPASRAPARWPAPAATLHPTRASPPPPASITEHWPW
jgi:hypothetical protein